MDWLGAAMVKHYKGDDGDMKLLLEAVASAFAGLPRWPGMTGESLLGAGMTAEMTAGRTAGEG